LEQTRRLSPGEAQLWCLPLRLPAEKFARLQSLLSADEIERSARFRKAANAQFYVSARGWLRTLLGSYLSTQPGDLQFYYDGLGKPHLADEKDKISFSVSHSDEWGLFGFVLKHRIGVDLERIRTDLEIEELARRFFSPNEFRKLRSLPADQRRMAFFCGWTRKEACLKALGKGLSYGLDRIEVTLAPGESATLIKMADDPNAFRRWTIHHLSPLATYVGAAAVEAQKVTFRSFGWGRSSPAELP